MFSGENGMEEGEAGLLILCVCYVQCLVTINLVCLECMFVYIFLGSKGSA